MNDGKTLAGFWRYEQAAAFMGISPLTLRGKVCRREVPYIKPFGPHGRVLFNPDRLREFVERGAVEPAE